MPFGIWITKVLLDYRLFLKWVYAHVNGILLFFILGAILAYSAACSRAEDKSKQLLQVSTAPERFYTDSVSIQKLEFWDSEDSLWLPIVASFYAQHQFKLHWIRNGELTEQSQFLVQLISSGTEEKDSTLILEMKEANDRFFESKIGLDVKVALRIDVIHTLLFLKYARINYVTNIPQSKRNELGWNIQKNQSDYLQLLEDFISGKERKVFQKKAIYSQFYKLKSQLPKFRKLEREIQWPQLQLDNTNCRVGDSDSIIHSARLILGYLGYKVAAENTLTLDTTLSSVIQLFQRHNGIKASGILDQKTMQVLNITPGQRIQQILVNMERCKWLPQEPDGKYLAVNIPDFKLLVYDQHDLLWSCNVVVGRKNTRTVIFNNELSLIVFNPYWNVPRSIMANEIIPKIKKDPGYLSRQNMEVFNSSGQVISSENINWSAYSGRDFPWNIRQRPGANNALGKVKFLFPNEHNIYLHDTPSKSLFLEQVRAFSHGCIRVQEPVKLAAFLLRDHPDWNLDRINTTMQQSKEVSVRVSPKVPVFIAYFTAWVDRDGNIHFRDDIYGHDRDLFELLSNSNDN
jgi:L,D-transpeptidase YcbB